MSAIEEVREVLQRYIDATYTADIDAFKELFHPSAVMNGFLGGELGMSGPEPFYEVLSANPSMKAGGVPYEGSIENVDVAGDIACGTIRENGFAGTFQFVNFFHLVRIDGRWWLTSKTYTTL